MLVKKYKYNGQTFSSPAAVRQAIWQHEHKIFGKPGSAAEWAQLGVSVLETESLPEAAPRTPSLWEQKQIKLAEVDIAFSKCRESSQTYLVSSLGFKVNANTAAFSNITGLVAQLQFREYSGEESPEIEFMDYDGELRPLGLSELKTIQFEISSNNSRLYSQKWALKRCIQDATDEGSLGAIGVVFVHTDFSM